MDREGGVRRVGQRGSRQGGWGEEGVDREGKMKYCTLVVLHRPFF